MTDSDAESVKSGNGGSKANKNGDKVKKGGKSATSWRNGRRQRTGASQHPHPVPDAHRRQLRRVGGEDEDYL